MSIGQLAETWWYLGETLGSHGLISLPDCLWVVQGVHDAGRQVRVEDWLLHGQLTLQQNEVRSFGWIGSTHVRRSLTLPYKLI